MSIQWFWNSCALEKGFTCGLLFVSGKYPSFRVLWSIFQYSYIFPGYQVCSKLILPRKLTFSFSPIFFYPSYFVLFSDFLFFHVVCSSSHNDAIQMFVEFFCFAMGFRDYISFFVVFHFKGGSWFFSHHDVALMLGIFIVSLCFSCHEASLMMGMFCCAPGPALLCFSNSFYVQIHSKSSAYPIQRNQSCFYVP